MFARVTTADVRTQIYLPRRLHSALIRVARERGVSMAELIREGAERVLREESPLERDPFEGLIGVVRDGKRDISAEHDRYLSTRRRSKR